MTIFILKRIGLGLITLWILSIIVFFAAQVLPGDPARAILGPFAQPSAVNALNHQLGTDKPLIAQYFTWIGHILTGNLGTSYAQQTPIGPILGKALVNSLKLAILAFIIVVPLGIIGGVLSALNVGQAAWTAAISVVGLSATVIPEVVSGIVRDPGVRDLAQRPAHPGLHAAGRRASATRSTT